MDQRNRPGDPSDGVETICDMAFSMCLKPLTLVIPPSVKVIGRDLFGSEGGRIVL